MREQPEPTHAPTPPLPWWLATIVILGALLTAGGGILALVRPETLIGSGQRMNEAAYVYAGYLVSRNLALAIMLLATLALRAWRMLAGLMVLAALTQLIDAVVDATTGRSTLLPIVLIFAVAFLIGVTQLSRKAS
ncbi:MAG TPA: hypothetical protein VF916_12910 [Ktedonobacterales bacterium]